MSTAQDYTILIVDDEEALRKELVLDFQRQGFKVLDAGNGTDAFNIVKSQHVDLVLTDAKMPDGDGIQLLQNVKSIYPFMPVVMFITSFADITIEEAYDHGADAVFPKSFGRKSLLEAVDKALTSKNLVWTNRGTDRFDTDLPVEIALPELKLTMQGRTTNFGRGGFFISLADPQPSIGSRVAFTIKCALKTTDKIEGFGTVRWVRNGDEPGQPRGCGIEFELLNEPTRKNVIALLEDLKTTSITAK